MASMRAFVRRVNDANPGQRARRIPTVPDDLTLDFIYENYDVPATAVPLGLSYATVEPVAADLASQFSLSIVSKDEAAALPVLRALMADLRRNAFDRPVELHVVDSLTGRSPPWRDSALTAGYPRRLQRGGHRPRPRAGAPGAALRPGGREGPRGARRRAVPGGRGELAPRRSTTSPSPRS